MKTWVLLATILATGAARVGAGDSIFDVKLKDIDGKESSLEAYRGKVLLAVNVASKCGHTPQYAGLEALYQKYRKQGLVVLGFPCNQFGAQEPGTNEEIKQFCSSRYHVSFPLWDKIDVNGPHRHALYGLLAGKDSPVAGDIRWNFTKFLVGRDGKILGRFEPKTKPEAPELVTAVEAALAAK
jgi:glutathione peroxidase